MPIFQSDWVNWKKLILLSFAPAVACLLTLMLHAEPIAVLIGTFGSLSCGLYGARLIMKGFNLDGWKRTSLHFVFALVFCALDFTFCVLGCAGGAAATGQW